MIEFSVSPCSDGMAAGTGRSSGGKIRSDVIGHVAACGLCFIPVGRVARHAIGRIERVVVVDVARDAGSRSGRRVRAGQSETCGVVIERGGIPGNRVVACGAIGSGKRGAGRGVDRIVGLLPSGQVAAGVAAIVGLRREIVVAANVAVGAGSYFTRGRELMGIGQWETSGAVIEFPIGPYRYGVATGTG